MTLFALIPNLSTVVITRVSYYFRNPINLPALFSTAKNIPHIPPQIIAVIAVGFFRQYELVLIVFAPAHMPNGYDAIGNAIAVAQSCVLKFAMHFEMDGCLSVTGYSGWSVITPIISLYLFFTSKYSS